MTLWVVIGTLWLVLIALGLLFFAGADMARNRQHRRADKRIDKGLAARLAAKDREPDDVLRDNDGAWR